MNIFEKLMEWLKKHDRFREILDRDGAGVYLERGYLLWKSDGQGQKEHPFNIFLHKFLLSDTPGLFHDHPWWWISIVLTEGYWEHLIDGRVLWRKPWSIAFRKAEELHWVELPEGKYPMTLFIHGPRTRTWGFIEDDGSWTQWRAFIEKYRGTGKFAQKKVA